MNFLSCVLVTLSPALATTGAFAQAPDRGKKSRKPASLRGFRLVCEG